MKSIILAVLVAMGCVSTPYKQTEVSSLFVSYDGVGVVKVYIQVDGGNPQRLGSVTAGLPECFRLPRTYGTMKLLVGELGSREVIQSPEFDNTYKHWVWMLASHLMTTRINLFPADQSCFSRKVDART